MASERWLYYVSLVLALYRQIYAETAQNPSRIVLPIVHFKPYKKFGFVIRFTGKACIINILLIKASATNSTSLQ